MKIKKIITILLVVSSATTPKISLGMLRCGCSLHEISAIQAAERMARKRAKQELAEQKQRQKALCERERIVEQKRKRLAQRQVNREERAIHARCYPLATDYKNFVFQTKEEQRQTAALLTEELRELPIITYESASQYSEENILVLLKFRERKEDEVRAIQGVVNQKILKRLLEQDINAETINLDPDAPLPDEIQSLIGPCIEMCEKISKARERFRKINAPSKRSSSSNCPVQ